MQGMVSALKMITVSNFMKNPEEIKKMEHV